MGFIVAQFFILVLFSTFCSYISCENTITCGNTSFFIQYPFRLVQEEKDQKPQAKGHHHQFNLKCNSQGLTILTLPFTGDFYVRDIDYFWKKIQLYDPGNCLPGRLMNLSLLSSPFTAVDYKNYTFFSCPTELVGKYNLTAVKCLSNSTASSILAESGDEIKNLTGCNSTVSLKIPVSSNDQDEDNGFDGDLVLAWIDPSCNGDYCRGRSRSKSVLGIIITCFIAISIALLGILFCIGCCLRFTGVILDSDDPYIRRARTLLERALIALAPPPPPTRDQQLPFRASNEGPTIISAPSPDESSFGASTELLVIGGKNCISGPNGESCPICLEEYRASERLRRIYGCDHCFHASCLEKWLEKKSTCPVCRIFIN